MNSNISDNKNSRYRSRSRNSSANGRASNKKNNNSSNDSESSSKTRSSKLNNNDLSNQFPSASLLQEYEYASEGAVDKLFKIAELEQVNRHKREIELADSQRKTKRIGQLFGFLLLFVTIISVVILSFSGYKDVAKLLIICSFGVIAFSTLVSLIFSGSGVRYKNKRRNKHSNDRKNNSRNKYNNSSRVRNK